MRIDVLRKNRGTDPKNETCQLRQTEGGNLQAGLEVRASNEAALNLYRKMGFIQVNVSKSYYPDGEDAIVMTLAL